MMSFVISLEMPGDQIIKTFFRDTFNHEHSYFGGEIISSRIDFGYNGLWQL